MVKIKDNLFKRGANYSVRYCVPKEYWESVGKREIVRSLGTSSLSEARRLKHKAIYAIETELLEAQRLNALRSPLRVTQASTEHTQPIGTSAAVRVSEASYVWLKMCDGITAATKAGYYQVLKHFEEYSQDINVAQINRQFAQSYLEFLKVSESKQTGKPRSPRTIKTHMITLSSFWKVCRHLGHVDQDMANPFNGINAHMPGSKRVKQTTKRLRPVTRDEAEALLEAINSSSGLKYQSEMDCIVRLLWATGCRLNEICSLTRDQIKDHGDYISFSLTGTKTEAGDRLIFLVGDNECKLIRKALKVALTVTPSSHDNNRLLFPRLHRGGHDRKPSWYVGKALTRLRTETFGGDVEWDMHSFRRNAVSALVNAGVPVAERNLVVGHSNKADIGVSVYAKEGDLRKIVRGTFEVLYGELGGGVK